jgi:hypothetical protein
MLRIKYLSIIKLRCVVYKVITFYLEIVLAELARLDSVSVYHDRAREFNDPNFGFSES